MRCQLQAQLAAGQHSCVQAIWLDLMARAQLHRIGGRNTSGPLEVFVRKACHRAVEGHKQSMLCVISWRLSQPNSSLARTGQSSHSRCSCCLTAGDHVVTTIAETGVTGVTAP